MLYWKNDSIKEKETWLCDRLNVYRNQDRNMKLSIVKLVTQNSTCERNIFGLLNIFPKPSTSLKTKGERTQLS